MLHSGFPEKSSYLGLNSRLQIDDYLEISVGLNFQKFEVSGAENSDPSHKTNTVIFQFHPEPSPDNVRYDHANTLELHGLCIFIISHDRTDSTQQNKKPYYMTYRYFATPTTIQKEYLNVLVENQGFLKRRNSNPRIRHFREASRFEIRGGF